LENKKSEFRKNFINIGIVSVILFAVVFFGRIAWLAINTDIWTPIGQKHFAAVVGLPAAAIASFLLVIILETIKGNIEFEVLQFKFKGASGPIIMWILCFLTMSFAIWLLWDKTFATC